LVNAEVQDAAAPADGLGMTSATGTVNAGVRSALGPLLVVAAVLIGAWVLSPAGPARGVLLVLLNALVVVSVFIGLRRYKP